MKQFKTIFFVACFLMAAITLNAQENTVKNAPQKKVTFGLKAGLNFADITSEKGDFNNTKTKAGFHAGITLDSRLIVHSQYGIEAGQASAATLVAAGVSAIACSSDMLALGAIRAVKRAGLSVPHDVSVVGYDDSALMNSTEPPLTTLRQPIEPMGRAAVDILTRIIAGQADAAAELLFEPELVVRGSTALARADAA